MVVSGNMHARAYIHKQGGTRSRNLMQVTQDLNWLEEHQITLRCRHMPSHLNVLADSLYRDGQILATEWSIHPRVLEYI